MLTSYRLLILTAMTSAILCHSALGADSKIGPVMLYGILQDPPPCTINNGGDIDVNFGDKVGVESVDGVNYRMPLDYRISCTENRSTSVNIGLKLTLKGVASGFDGNAIHTNINDLGIRIYVNNGKGDIVFEPGKTVKITDGIPQLFAVPVKKAGAILPEGHFEATATLAVEYQ